MIKPLLQTKRLDLVPATLEHIKCELQNPSSLGAFLGVIVPTEWPPGEYDHDAMEFFHAKLEIEGAAGIGWYLWYVIVRSAAEQREKLIAAAGFLGPPSDGAVEIGFSVIPSARCRGFAVEIVTALVDYAFESAMVNEILAHTSGSNVASIKVLLHCGFQRIGIEQESGMVRYTLQKRRERDRDSG